MHTKACFEYISGRYRVKSLNVGERIVLKRVLEKQYLKVRVTGQNGCKRIYERTDLKGKYLTDSSITMPK